MMTESTNQIQQSDDGIIVIKVSQLARRKDTQPIRIKFKQYDALVNISRETGKSISDIASYLLAYAIERTKIIDESNR